MRRLVCVIGLSLAGFLAFGSGSTWAADVSFCAFGTGQGQCNQPAGVAVDRSDGRVYVVDRNNNRVNVFDEDGTFITSFGSAGSGPGQFSSPWSITVDNDPTSSAFHDVYVGDEPPDPNNPEKRNPRVQRFSPNGTFGLSFGEAQLSQRPHVAVGPGGTVFVGANEQVEVNPQTTETIGQIWKFSPAGTLLGVSTLPGNPLVGGLAVDSNEDLYVASTGSGDGSKYEFSEPTATLLFALPSGANIKALTVDPNDNLYVAELDGGIREITKRDSTGEVLKRFGYGQIEWNLNGLGIGTGSIFGSEENIGAPTPGNKVIRIEQPGPGPLACCLSSTPRNTSATLKGGVNPEGKSTTYHFEYLTQADYETSGFGGATKTPESTSVGSDFNLHGVEAKIGCAKVQVPPQSGCLEPGTEYRYRLIATNSDGISETEGTFTTLPPLDIEEVFATDVGTDAGRLHAVVNPLGIPATGYFEYVDDAGYQADLAQGEGHDGFAGAVKVPDIDAGGAPISLGEGEAAKEVARELSSLESDTVYHYRFVATDPFVTVKSEAKILTTFPPPSLPTRACPNEEFRTAASAVLPECRAYEMVSPVEKGNSDIKVLLSPSGYPSRLDQSSTDGNRFTYSSSTSFSDAISSPWSSQYLATRTAGGWSTHSLNPPRTSIPVTSGQIMKLTMPYKAFNPDLSSGWLMQNTEPPLDECGSPGFINLYRRDLETGEYEALTSAGAPIGTLQDYRLEVQGISDDGTHAVFRANAKLTEDAASSGGTNYQLYEHVADEGCGELRLVSYLPNGKPVNPKATPASAGGSVGQPGENLDSQVARGVSADGSRVFFTLGDTALAAEGRLYVRVNADKEQSPVSVEEPKPKVFTYKCTDPNLGCTLQITTEDAQFWTAATDGSKAVYSIGSSLYEFDTEKALAGEPASTLIAGGLIAGRGVAAANDILSRLYFVSGEALGGEGEEGKLNLYLREGGGIRLVATLGDFGSTPFLALKVGAPSMISNSVHMTVDGSHMAFVSNSSPTGYDNADAAGNGPVYEVYIYDAETDEVHCISCNPSGARPRAARVLSFGEIYPISAMMPPGESQHFSPRALTADGNRLFFESFEALLPRDTNGKADVYEWQRADGEKACEEAGAELYVLSAGGCLSLISSGQSPIDSEFADASPDGHDVFIRTQSSLLPQDNGLIDVYDARINGGFPQPPLPPAACEGEACQGPLNAPDDPTPASSAFEGSGNVKEEPTASRCRKPKVKRKGRCVTRKGHKRPVSRHKRRRAG